MTKEEMLEIFKECNEVFQSADRLDIRLSETEKSIVLLQEEAQKLKEERPILLADDKDVSKINKRLKKIDEELELNKDTIIGIKSKKQKIKDDIRSAKYRKKDAFQNYVGTIIESIEQQYMEMAPKFADLLVEYITLESICNGNESYIPQISYRDIKCIPNLQDKNHPFFEHKLYEIYHQNEKRIREKFDIPDYYVTRISINE